MGNAVWTAETGRGGNYGIDYHIKEKTITEE